MTCVYKENEDKIKMVEEEGMTTVKNAGFIGLIGL